MEKITQKLSAIRFWLYLTRRATILIGHGFIGRISLACFILSAKLPFFSKDTIRPFSVRVGDSFHTVYIRRIPSDIHILFEILIDRWYDSMLPKNSPAVIFDVGANIGLTSLYLKTKYPLAKIFCFEPDPNSFVVLEKNMQSHDDITCFNVGLWGEESSLSFFQSKHFSTRNSFFKEPGSNEVRVRVVTLDTARSMAGVTNVDFLKFDIEGAEVELFQGSTPGHIGSMLGELHPGLRSVPVIEELVAKLDTEFTTTVSKGSDRIWHISGQHR